MNPACDRCSSPLASAGDDCAHCAAEGVERGEPWLGRVVAGQYRVVGRLGSGASSRVYRVADVHDGSRLALKIMRIDRGIRLGSWRDPARVVEPSADSDSDSDSDGTENEAKDRFMREARVLNRIHHAGVVSVRDLGELETGAAYLVMELVEGESLHAALRRGRLEADAALVIASRVADALVAVHAEGVAHRDLKPSNVLLGPAEETPRSVKLVDFGIASLAHSISITGPNQRLGTPGYMAPEYVRTGRASPRTDQYSLGVMLYEMLSQRMPFEAPSHGRLLLMQSREAPAPLSVRVPGVQPGLEALVMRAIAPDPEARFENCGAFRAAIDAELAAFPIDRRTSR